MADHVAKNDAERGRADEGGRRSRQDRPDAGRGPDSGPGRPRKTHVLIRGDFLRPGVAVQANTPAVLPLVAERRQTDAPRPGEVDRRGRRTR